MHIFKKFNNGKECFEIHKLIFFVAHSLLPSRALWAWSMWDTREAEKCARNFQRYGLIRGPNSRCKMFSVHQAVRLVRPIRRNPLLEATL